MIAVRDWNDSAVKGWVCMHRTESTRIIDEVLQKERREVAIFRRLASKVKTPLGKAVFMDYAEKGRALCSSLEDLKRSHETGGEGSQVHGQGCVGTVRVVDHDDYEEKLSRAMEKALEKFDDIRAIEVAARIVRKTARAISRSYEAVRDPAYRDALREIERAERENFMHLKNIEEYLKDPQAWFREREHHHLDGA